MADPNARESKTKTVAGWIRILVQIRASALLEPSSDNTGIGGRDSRAEAASTWTSTRRIHRPIQGSYPAPIETSKCTNRSIVLAMSQAPIRHRQHRERCQATCCHCARYGDDGTGCPTRRSCRLRTVRLPLIPYRISYFSHCKRGISRKCRALVLLMAQRDFGWVVSYRRKPKNIATMRRSAFDLPRKRTP